MSTLYVYMNGRKVGEYIQHKRGVQAFVYADSWLSLAGSMPLSLSLPMTEKNHKGDNVYNYFDNLLPDSSEIRHRIQSRFGAKTDRPFDLLSHIGIDCVGAIQLMSQETDFDIKKIESNVVTEGEIAERLRNYKTLPLGMSSTQHFRISIAGAHEKTAFLWRDNDWHIPVGATPTTHIFKLPVGNIEHQGIDLSDSVENEWLCSKIIAAFGLPVAETRIERFEDTKALIVTRFDRRKTNDGAWIQRLPQEDMCQANACAPALKYESDGGPGVATIMQTLMSAINPEADRQKFIKSLFIFWLLAAIDGHAKNFSLFLKNRGQFELTPLYDVISAYPLTANRQLEKRGIKMAMALHGKNTHYEWFNMMPRHWFEEAKRVNFPASDMQLIIDETISNVDSVIDKVTQQLPDHFPEEISQAIFTGMKEAARRFKTL